MEKEEHMNCQSEKKFSELTSKVLKYQSLNKEKDKQKVKIIKKLEAEIIHESYLIIYRYPVSIKLIPEEDASDFLLKIVNRIPRIISEFYYANISFESYLHKIVFWQASTYLQRKNNKERRYACDVKPNEDIEQSLASDNCGYTPYNDNPWYGCANPPPEFIPDVDTDLLEDQPYNKIQTLIQKSHKFRFRFLQLVLLCSDSLDAAQIAFLADFLAMEEKELADMISSAIEKGYRRLQITKETRAVRDAHFFEKLFLERELNMLRNFNADPYFVEKIEKKLNRENYYFQERREEARSRPGSVSHSMVAQVLNIPKGTIDSGMHALRKIVNKMVDD
jgi:hypothetical protein